MRSGSSARSCHGPTTLEGGLDKWGGEQVGGRARKRPSGLVGVEEGVYIEIAFSTEDIADFFVDVEVFFVERFNHRGILFPLQLRRYFDLPP
jgi:hypothetical protein